jgi:hypothetical protein
LRNLEFFLVAEREDPGDDDSNVSSTAHHNDGHAYRDEDG